MDRFWLTQEQFAKIAPHLPTDTRGKERVDDRRVISGIIHVLKSGGRWADVPTEVYGPKKTLYDRFAQVLIDSSAVRAHRCASRANVWPAPSASGICALI